MSNFKYSLEICSEENRGAIFELNRNENVVGRGNVDISINNATLSTTHCLLRHNGTQITVTDLQSRNGTAVNNQKIIAETTITSGDILTVGEVRLRVTASSSKERLSTSNSSLEKNNSFKIFLNRFSQPKSVKSQYELASRNLLLSLVLLSWLILILPIYFIMQDKVTESRVERACALVSSLAASNIEAMKLGKQVMVDTSFIANEPGVSLAIIMTNKGVVWAPKSLLNKSASDNYGEKSTNAEQLLIQQRNDGNLDISLPIKYYDFKNGQSIKIGIARIIYDIKSLDKGPHWLLIAGLCSIVYLLITMYCFRKIVQTVKDDLLVFQEDCEDVIKGTSTFLEERYSPEFNDLTITFNRVLRKLNVPQTPETTVTHAHIADLIKHLEQAALLVDKTNVVICSNPKVHSILGSSSESLDNSSLLEMHSERVFFPDFLAFTCDATQSDIATSASFQSPPHGDIQITSLPVTKEHYLFLLTVTQ